MTWNWDTPFARIWRLRFLSALHPSSHPESQWGVVTSALCCPHNKTWQWSKDVQDTPWACFRGTGCSKTITMYAHHYIFILTEGCCYIIGLLLVLLQNIAWECGEYNESDSDYYCTYVSGFVPFYVHPFFKFEVMFIYSWPLLRSNCWLFVYSMFSLLFSSIFLTFWLIFFRVFL